MGIEREFGECRVGDGGGGVAVAVRWSTTLLSTFACVPTDNIVIHLRSKTTVFVKTELEKRRSRDYEQVNLKISISKNTACLLLLLLLVSFIRPSSLPDRNEI